MSNLDKVKPGVAVVIDGKERRLILDWWAVSVIEEEKGIDYLSNSFRNMSIPTLFFLTWAALLRDMPELDGVTPERRRAGQKIVVEMCSRNTDRKALIEAMGQAIINSAPVQDLKQGEPEKNEVNESQEMN